jgi:hypothetical protein
LRIFLRELIFDIEESFYGIAFWREFVVSGTLALRRQTGDQARTASALGCGDRCQHP